MRIQFLRPAALLVLASFCLARAGAEELTVSAAASLTDALTGVAKAFEQTHPGAKVTLNFAASGPLLAQIAQGAPVDVFASADEATMDRAAAGALVKPQSRADFAANALVLVLPAQSTAQPKQLADLQGPGFQRIALGNPSTVPAGRYAAQAVDAARLSTALQSRWIYAESVRQVLSYVARGEVDAGFVYRTDALIDKQQVRVGFAVATAEPVRYPMAQVAASKHPALAQAFIDFVQGPTGQALLAGYGFDKPH